MKKFELLLFSEYVQIVNEYGRIDKETPREKNEKNINWFSNVFNGEAEL